MKELPNRVHKEDDKFDQFGRKCDYMPKLPTRLKAGNSASERVYDKLWVDVFKQVSRVAVNESLH